MKKRKIKKKAFAKLFLVIALILLGIGGFFAFDYIKKELNGESKYLLLNLVGDKKITLKYKEEYVDQGATASYKDEDISNTIIVDTNIDYEHLGTYKYTYEVKYKKLDKKVERTIQIVDEEKPEIKLNGDSTITVIETNKYEDLGATATDNYDGDLTEKIEVDKANLDTSKVGTYKVKYTVKDSSGNENEIERTVKVEKKPPKNQKVAVINYHFFYKDWSEGCHESLCLRIDKFKEELKYLNDNGFTTLTMKEFVDWMYGEIEIPEKSVLLTIDDGAFGTSKIRGNYLIPALEKYKVHATLFLITGWWGVDGGIDNYK